MIIFATELTLQHQQSTCLQGSFLCSPVLPGSSKEIEELDESAHVEESPPGRCLKSGFEDSFSSSCLGFAWLPEIFNCDSVWPNFLHVHGFQFMAIVHLLGPEVLGDCFISTLGCSMFHS